MDEAVIKNKNPPILVDIFYIFLDFIENYGWMLLIGGIMTYLIFQKLYNIIQENLKKKQTTLTASYPEDPRKLQERALAIERARQRMQEKLDRDAEEFKLKQKMKEEKKRAEWLERHGNLTETGNKLGSGNDSNDGSKKYKKEYNPLSGDTSGPSYRRPKRSGCGSGGCG